jgi:hypothetical protein
MGPYKYRAVGMSPTHLPCQPPLTGCQTGWSAPSVMCSDLYHQRMVAGGSLPRSVEWCMIVECTGGQLLICIVLIGGCFHTSHIRSCTALQPVGQPVAAKLTEPWGLVHQCCQFQIMGLIWLQYGVGANMVQLTCMDGVMKGWRFHPLLDRCRRSGAQCGDDRVNAKLAMRLGWCDDSHSGLSMQVRWS